MLRETAFRFAVVLPVQALATAVTAGLEIPFQRDIAAGTEIEDAALKVILVENVL